MHRVFGLDEFRPGQLEVIESVLAGRDTLAIMPTGAGKSLCYQLPAVIMPGMTLVISPLISLMQDQTEKLSDLGLEASQLNSTLTAREEHATMDAIERERPAFLITTPERASQPEFLATLEAVRIDLVVIDEAHCIPQWGHDFRTAYLDLARVIRTLGRPPILALTATATAETVADIREQLELKNLRVVDTGIFRSNLHYEVLPEKHDEAKRARLVALLRELPGLGIVYASTVKHVESLVTWLTSLGLPVARYHGRLGAHARRDAQERFMRGELKAIVATNAFGLGIDKADIRFVLHYSMPGHLDAYYQESGRAGRDGDPSRCILLYHPDDRRTHAFFLGGKHPRLKDADAVHAALRTLDAHATPATVDEIHAAATGVAKSKTRAVLAEMADLGLVREMADGRFRLRQEGVDPKGIARFTEACDAQQQQERAKLDRMVAYAQSARCRWRLLREAFGEEPGDLTECGTCDNCRRGVEREVLATASATP